MSEILKVIEKQNGGNYVVWKTRMRALLVSKRYWSVVEKLHRPAHEDEVGTEPIEGVGCTTQQPSNEDATPSDEDVAQSEKGIDIILLSLQEEKMIHIEDCTTFSQGWYKLEQLYSETCTANRIRLYEKCLTLRLVSGISIREHVHSFARTRYGLRSVGVNIENSLYKLALLRSLSNSFESLVVALESQIDSISVDELHAILYREEARQSKTNSVEPPRAFTAQFDTKRKTVQYRKSPVTCYYCNKKGHRIAECRKKKRE